MRYPEGCLASWDMAKGLIFMSPREKALSTIGSKHKLKRWQIDITSVEEIPADQVVNHVVKYQIGE